MEDEIGMIFAKRCYGLAAFLLVAGINGATLRGEEPHGVAPDAGVLRVGAAVSEITPEMEYPVHGYYYERLSTGMKDPLQAKALVFRQGNHAAAFVVCDLSAIASDLSKAVRKRVTQQTGIPERHIIVAATHTHTGPDYTRELFSVASGRPLPESWANRQPYVPKLIEAIAAAVANADTAAKEAKLFAGTATQDPPVAFNRRGLTKNGEIRTWYGLNDPEILRPAGPIDSSVGIMVVRDAAQGSISALLCSHALHADTVSGTLWSADYPYFIARTVKSAFGNSVIALFANGCCGNINHVDPKGSARNSTEFIGTALGKTVTAATSQLVEVRTPQLQVRREEVKLPLQVSTPEQLSQAKRLLLEIQAGKTADFYEHVDAYKRMVLEHLRGPSDVEETMSLIGSGLSESKADSGDSLSVEVQVITLGRDVAIVALPGEVFVEYGLAIKAASPFRTTLVIELCNSSETLYIPTRSAYVPTASSFVAGGYEVVNSTTMPGSGDLLVDAAIRMLVDCAHQVND